MANKKKKSKMDRITKLVSWFMLIAMLGSALIATGIALYNYFVK